MDMRIMNPRLGADVLQKLLWANREIADKNRRAEVKRSIIEEAEAKQHDRQS